jgi:hypothetical protein
MKNLTNSLFQEHRFVFGAMDGGPKVEAAKPVPVPVGETPEDAKKLDAQDMALKDLERSANDPEGLATAFQRATEATKAVYEGKDHDAVKQGQFEMDRMLQAMGVTDPEQVAAIQKQYESAFVDQNLVTADENLMTKELDAASMEEAGYILYDLQGVYNAEVSTTYDPEIAKYTEQLGFAKGAIIDQTRIIDEADATIDAYEDQAGVVQDDLNNYLAKYNISPQSAVSKDSFKALLTQREGGADLADPAIVDQKADKAYKVYLTKAEAITNNAKTIEEAKAQKEAAQKALSTAESREYTANMMLNARESAKKTALQQVTDGTYKPGTGATAMDLLSGSKDLDLNHMAANKAREDRTNYAGEQAVLAKYATITQDKSNELLRGVVLSKLGDMDKAKVDEMTAKDQQIAELANSHDGEIAKAEQGVRAKLDGFSVDKNVPLDDDKAILDALTKHVEGLVYGKNGEYKETALDGEVESKVARGMKAIETARSQVTTAKAAKEAAVAVLVGEKDRIQASRDPISKAMAQLNQPPVSPVMQAGEAALPGEQAFGEQSRTGSEG